MEGEVGDERLLLEWEKHRNAAKDYIKGLVGEEAQVGRQLVIVIQDSEGLRGVPITPEEFRIARNVAYMLNVMDGYDGPKIPPNKVYLIKVTEDPNTGEVLVFMADPANEPI